MSPLQGWTSPLNPFCLHKAELDHWMNVSLIGLNLTTEFMSPSQGWTWPLNLCRPRRSEISRMGGFCFDMAYITATGIFHISCFTEVWGGFSSLCDIMLLWDIYIYIYIYINIYIGTACFPKYHRWLPMADGWWPIITIYIYMIMHYGIYQTVC